MRFLPTITLSNSTILDPSKQTDPMSWAKDNEEYKYYLSQLEIVNDSNNDVLKVTSDDSKLSIHLEKIGTSKLGLRLKGSSYNLHTATINVTQGKNDDTNNYTAVINPIDQSTTTNNKNLNITRIEFVDRSYVLDGDFGWGFKPIITLSDGTKLSSTSENQDVYNYYLSLTELFLNNDISNSTIDFGVVEVNNNILPRTLMPLKDGKVFLSVGVKSNSLVYDTVPVTVSIGK